MLARPLNRSSLLVIAEYVDVLTGKTPYRLSYQQLLVDARQGKFSHVIVERADRFGRNDTKALRAMDELHETFRVSHWIEIDPERAAVWHGEASSLVGISDRERV